MHRLSLCFIRDAIIFIDIVNILYFVCDLRFSQWLFWMVCRLGYNAIQSVECLLMFHRNRALLILVSCWFLAWHIFFYREGGGSMFVWNVTSLYYIISQKTELCSSISFFFALVEEVCWTSPFQSTSLRIHKGLYCLIDRTVLQELLNMKPLISNPNYALGDSELQIWRN
jgi:hypothetical protein